MDTVHHMNEGKRAFPRRFVERRGIDRHARDILYNVLTGFVQGHIRSRAVDGTVMACAWGECFDRGVRTIAEALYSLYDDFSDEPLKAAPDVVEALERARVFLRTDLEYVHPDGPDLVWQSVGSFWPFASQAQWIAHRPAASEALPAYNPALPRRPHVRSGHDAVFWWIVAAVFVPVAAAIIWFVSR